MVNFLKSFFTAIVFSALFNTIQANALPSRTIISDLIATQNLNGINLRFKLNNHVAYQGFLLSHPSRFVIDIKNTQLNTSLDQPAMHHTHLLSVHSAYNKNNLRLVFEFKEATKIKITQLKSLNEQQHELLLEFIKKSSDILDSNADKKLEADLEDAIAKTTVKKQNSRDIVVAIDPGHGGDDPGAIGQCGTQEKRVVLAIARELETLINNEPGFHAVLTRRGDYFLPLRKRLAIARHYKADMLIAVHADAYMNNEARGASVYSLSNRGATSEAAHWLAEKENHSELLDGAKLIDDHSILRSVLLNLQQTATIGASLQLGSCILNYLGHCTKLHHNRMEQAAFVVLKSPDISSLLVETGFISNKEEEKLLNKQAYQHQLAQAITEGIKDYYHLKPPGGTFLSALMGRDSKL